MIRWLLFPVRLVVECYVRWWIRSMRRVRQEGDL